MAEPKTTEVQEHKNAESGGMMKICKVCGETQEEHHLPEWLEIPDGCVCNWREWAYDGMSSLPAVCDRYEGNGTQNCSRCEHDKACHKACHGEDKQEAL